MCPQVWGHRPRLELDVYLKQELREDVPTGMGSQSRVRALSEGADRISGQLLGDKSASNRVQRKVPESDGGGGMHKFYSLRTVHVKPGCDVGWGRCA